MKEEKSMRMLSDVEMMTLKGGEVFTIAAVMACLTAAIVAVICYRLFTSKSGSTTLPGGFKFTWA